MNNNRKQSSSIFNSSFPSPAPLPPTPQRRRFEIPTPPPPLLMKSEPTDSLHHLPPLPPSTTSFQQPRPRTTKNVVAPTSKIARQRRARLSDKTRCLQKQIPLERQMDTATLYDQTYKYVKFLEAQVAVLQSMPLQIPTSTSSTNTNTTSHRLRYQNMDEFGRLNRQQLLQVLMRSEVAQTVMYTNGWCVFSAEQLAVLFNDREQQGVMVEQRFI